MSKEKIDKHNSNVRATTNIVRRYNEIIGSKDKEIEKRGKDKNSLHDEIKRLKDTILELKIKLAQK
jgi:hypothetical protein